MAPCHGTMGPRQCVSLPQVMHDIVRETKYSNNKHVKQEDYYFLYIPTELEEPHFGAVTRIMCNRVLLKVSKQCST